jgi:hypothetical protein
VLLYLDLNCFNRPFDDQSQDRIARGAAAVFSLLHWIVDGIDQLTCSAVLEFENSQHPLMDRRTELRVGRTARLAMWPLVTGCRRMLKR